MRKTEPVMTMRLISTVVAVVSTGIQFSQACSSDAHAVPEWYSSTRFHAHTRLEALSYCNSTACKPVFDDAAKLFAEIGVHAFVRHTHTGSDGDWMRYPSAPIPEDGLLPVVRNTGRQLPIEITKKAHDAGAHFVAYHYPRCHAYYSAHEPTWLSRDVEGNPVKFSRGLGLCINTGWRETYLSQLHDLVYHAGVDGVYVDEYPIPPQGCFCDACRAKYQEWSGGEPMPKDPTKDPAQYKKVLQYNTYTVTKFYGDIARTIANASEMGVAAGNRTAPAIPFLSTHQLPCADSGGELFEWQGMEAQDGVLQVPKIEYDTGRGVPCLRGFEGNLANASFDTDIFITWGWATSRDASYGRPPHTWDPASSEGSDYVQCGAGAMVSYGLVANPDHSEGGIPNATLFAETYKVGNRLAGVLDGLEPVGWASVAMDEWRRDELVPLVNKPATPDQQVWTGLMGATMGAWHTLTRWNVPRRVAHLWQIGDVPNSNATGPGVTPDPQAVLQRGMTRVLVLPQQARPTAAQQSALDSYVAAGGKVVNMTGIPTGDWLDAAKRPGAAAKLQAMITGAVGAPPAALKYNPAMQTTTDSEGGVSGVPVPPQSIDAHMNVFAVPGQANASPVLAVTNAFAWCGKRERAPRRPPNVTNAIVELVAKPGISSSSVSAFDHVSQVNVTVRDSSSKPGVLEVLLPEFQFYAMVKMSCTSPAGCFTFSV